jgi:hypothetical protein
LNVAKNNFVEAKSNQAKLGKNVMQVWNNFFRANGTMCMMKAHVEIIE